MRAWIRTCLLILLALAAGAAATPFVRAQTPACAPIAALEKALAERFGERLFWRGIENRGYEMRVYRNATTGSWTLLMLQGDRSCAIAAGMQHFAGAPPRPGAEF